MTLSELLNRPTSILLEAISGSHAYGTAVDGSDIDIKGVFLLPKDFFFGLSYTSQLSDERNDIVYYELGRFTDLLCKNNPNILELLASPADCLRKRHPVLDTYTPDLFLSRKCCQTFGGYAMAQIKKARGLNKKIVNPVDKALKTPLDFCFILVKSHKSYPLVKWLEAKGWAQEDCGLASIPHFKNTYALYHSTDKAYSYKGIIQKATSNDISLSSIPKGMESAATLYFNKDGYQTYCKEYKQYWEWVENRNELRYKGTIKHGKRYDAKNMMHTFRLLDMAEEIAKEGVIRVRRPNRDFLLSIRRGEYEYEQLLEWAKERMQRIELLFDQSRLPEAPDLDIIEKRLVANREALYCYL
jgi:predicted nucleotidyltransferase